MHKIINTSVNLRCHKCSGTGKIKIKKCSVCNGTGKWNEESYILVTKDLTGQQIAFSVDSAGK